MRSAASARLTLAMATGLAMTSGATDIGKTPSCDRSGMTGSSDGQRAVRLERSAASRDQPLLSVYNQKKVRTACTRTRPVAVRCQYTPGRTRQRTWRV